MSSSSLAAGIRQLRGRLAAQQAHADDDEQLLHAFTTNRDGNAFAVLMRGHGPMVLGVCRRVLGHEQDAEDAFQATFLVLARNADALRNKSSLASFLHGTAYRTAMKAKQSSARRRKHEGSLGARTQPRSPGNPADELSWREVRALLDEEIDRLPEKYRSVFVLCCLENLSRAEAGQRLGLKERTVLSRLAEARKRLQGRLTKRGVELTAVLAAAALATPPVSAVPTGVMVTTIQAALAMAAGEKWAGVVSAKVVELVKSATARMLASKAKIATLLLATATLLAGAGVWSCRILATPQPSESPTQTAAAAKDRQDARQVKSEEATVSGRVIDPDDKPLPGAKLLFIYGSGRKYPHKVWATSAAEGRFTFTVPVKDVDNGYSEKPWEGTYVVAAAQGYGFAATCLGKPGATELTLRLVKDDVPIRGRILNLEGKPVAGVRVRIADILRVPDKGDLTDWLAALKAAKPLRGHWTYLTGLYSPAFDLLFPPVTTGEDGRFELKGIGRERIANLRIEGPTIATQEIHVMTRASEEVRAPVQQEFPKGQVDTYLGNTFELLAAPTRPIVGVVRDKETGKPLSDIRVESRMIANNFHAGFISSTTDKDGRYRLVGLPKADGNEIAATTNERPYLSAVIKVDNSLGFEPITVDFALQRGIWVKGRVMDKATGKPLWAGVEYFCFGDNPRANQIARLSGGYNWRSSFEDGRFQIPVLPGHGLIGVRAYHDHYLKGVGADRIKGQRPEGLPPGSFITTPYLCFAANFHTLVEIDPKPDEESMVCDVTLDPGLTLKGTVLGPEGKPLPGARIAGLTEYGYWGNDPQSGSEFTVECLQPNKSRMIQAIHEGRKLSGYLVLRGDEKGPIQVSLQPWGALTGRIVTPLGSPLTRVRVNCHAEVMRDGQGVPSSELNAYPDKDGRFRIEGLLAGVKYELSVSRSNIQQTIAGGNPKDLTIKAGETKDFGDVTVQPMK